MKQAQFNRPDTAPGKPMWCERQYPEIAPGIAHPCPFDYWDGKAWRPGMPDNSSLWRLKDGTERGLVYVKAKTATPNLPWRRISIRRLEEIAV